MIKWGFYNFFFVIYKKWVTRLIIKKTNKDVILNRTKNYYENDKKRLKEQARDNYRSLSEEDKNKKGEYERNRHHNIPEEKKQNNYCETKKLK